MKTIDITPAWAWVAQFYFAMVDARENPKAIAGFYDELVRLGPEVRQSLRVYHSKRSDFAKREQARNTVVAIARKADADLAEKKKREERNDRS